jgi:hypothetical protein
MDCFGFRIYLTARSHKTKTEVKSSQVISVVTMMMRSASRRATSSGSSPFRCIAGRFSNSKNPTSTPSQIARFATTGRPTSAAAAAAGARIRDNTKSARVADYPASAALHPEPMLALAYDYVDFDDDDNDDDDQNISSLNTTAITSAANNGNNTSTIYPAPSAPQNTPASRKAGGGGGGAGAGGRYVLLHDPVGKMVIRYCHMRIFVVPSVVI